jgi:RNA polymerase sigma-70 factor (ECF subfamily)
MAETNLQELFVLLEKGDRDAFSRIYQQLKQPVYTICYRIVQSRETAEDITHDVFVKLFRCPPDASVQNIRAWIFQMARNLSIDALRKESRRSDRDAPIEIEDPYPHLDLRMDIEAALGNLSCDEREILTLHLNAALNFREISHITGLSLPATYRRYRNALKLLQKALNGG